MLVETWNESDRLLQKKSAKLFSEAVYIVHFISYEFQCNTTWFNIVFAIVSHN